MGEENEVPLGGGGATSLTFIKGRDDSTLASTLNLFLGVSEVSTKIKQIRFADANQDIVVERIVGILQAQKHVQISLMNTGAEVVWVRETYPPHTQLCIQSSWKVGV